MPFKIYTSLSPIGLPLEFPRSDVPALSAIAGRCPSHEGGVTLQALARLSYFSNGVTRVLRGMLYGVVGTKPGHILFSSAGAEQRAYPPEHLQVPNYDDLFVDIGAQSATEALEMGVRPGVELTYDRDLQWLGDGRHGHVTGRALDDRVGCLTLLESIRLLAASAVNLADRCVAGIQADEERCNELIEKSLAMCTALVPEIGYDAAAAIAKESYKTGKTVREIAAKKMSPKRLKEILDPLRMTKPGIAAKGE